MLVPDNQDSFSLFAYLSPELIKFSDQNSRDSVLRELTELASSAGCLHNQEDFFQALITRENIMSTGIGMGIAIPHGKIEDGSRFFIVVGIHSEGLFWDSVDGSLVKLIFLIGGPKNAQSEYLKLLSTLTLCLQEESRRQQLLQVETVDEVLNVFLGM